MYINAILDPHSPIEAAVINRKLQPIHIQRHAKMRELTATLQYLIESTLLCTLYHVHIQLYDLEIGIL